MKWKIKFSKQAEKYYKKLPLENRLKIKNELINISFFKSPITHKDVLPLSGKLEGFYRLRVGKYRIIFSLLKKIKTIAIVNLLPRGDVYKK